MQTYGQKNHKSVLSIKDIITFIKVCKKSKYEREQLQKLNYVGDRVYNGIASCDGFTDKNSQGANT